MREAAIKYYPITVHVYGIFIRVISIIGTAADTASKSHCVGKNGESHMRTVASQATIFNPCIIGIGMEGRKGIGFYLTFNSLDHKRDRDLY